MSVVSAVAPQSFARTTPYISTDQFKTHRQAGVSVENLVPGGDPAAQDFALRGYIEEAADWINEEAQVPTFTAHVDTWAGFCTVDRYGYALVFPPVQPVIGLLSFSIGPNPSQLGALSSLGGIMFMPTGGLKVPTAASALLTSSQGPIQFGGVAAPANQAWCQFSYVGGFPVTQLTTDVTAGALLLSVADTTGIVAGKTWLTVYALTGRFSFLAGTVSTADSGGLGTGPGTVVCTAAPAAISNSASAPIFVSALPADLIAANVLVTRALIKQKGSGAVSSQSATSRSTKQGRQGAGDDFAEAWLMVENHMNPVGDFQA